MERCNKPATHFCTANGFRVCEACLELQSNKEQFESIDIEGKCDRPLYYEVPESNYGVLQERIAKLNKRAAKLGCDPIKLNVMGEHEQPVHEKDATGHTLYDRNNKPVVRFYRKYFHVTVTGNAPKLNGWEFLAVIEPVTDEEGKVLGNILRAVPNASQPIPERFRKAESHCDHCNTIRRRSQTFVIGHCDFDASVPRVVKQVGRNCLRDFLGHTDPERYANMAEWLMEAHALIGGAEDSDFFGSGVRQVERFDAEEVLALTACSVRLDGWRSNKVAREFGSQSTSAAIIEWLYAKPEVRNKWAKPYLVTDEDKATAKEVVEWLATLHQRDLTSDYIHNLSLLGQGARFTTREFGLACSALPTYLKEKEQEINKRKRFTEDKDSQFVGEVGKRTDFLNLTLVWTRDFESDWGTSHLYKFKDEAGNVLVWFSSSIFWNAEQKRDIDVGDVVHLTASVKKHEVRDGVKQTSITRAVTYKSKEQKKAEAKARKEERANAQAAIA